MVVKKMESYKTTRGRKKTQKAEKKWKTKIRTGNKSNKQKTVRNMVNINQTISIVTLNINGRNTPLERHRLLQWIKNKTQLYDVYKNLKEKLRKHSHLPLQQKE